MRFAEKMLEAAKTHELVAGVRHDKDGRRCALGLVEGEGSLHPSYQCYYEASEDETAENLYPWITQSPLPYPCDCPCACFGAISANYLIAHIFNEHVMEGKTWTLEQLAVWIDSIDPTTKDLVPSATH